MPQISANNIELFYDTFGEPADPPVVLIMGLGTQMTGWDDAFCKMLAERSLYVVRFDNRDVGLSSKIETGVQPNPIAVLMGDHSTVAYSLEDMASDTIGLMDALDIERGHLVGASMGGMIAQIVAIEHPQRVLSLTLIMSTTGNPSVGQPSQEAVNSMFSTTSGNDREAIVQSLMDVQENLASPGSKLSERQRRAQAEAAYDRSHYPEGSARQLVAVMAASDRTDRLRKLTIPTAVIHGSDDPLINVSGGVATAEAISDSKLTILDGMGHELPFEKWQFLVDAIAENVARA